MRGRSPFYHRSPVTDPAHFFGRRRELELVLARTAGATKPQCVSVVGSRRIGKSSLFRQLADVHGPAASTAGEPLACVYHDLEGSGRLTVEAFFRSLTRRVRKQLARQGIEAPEAPGGDAPTEEAFSELVEDLSDEGVRLVLFLDEFDSVTLNEHFDADLFGRLRYLTNSFSLAYVTSSYAELTELCHQDEIRQSPFFNVFSTVSLGLLEPEAARDLMTAESTAAGSPFTEEEMAVATELGGTHPFHLQQACDAIWTAVGDDPRAESVRRAFLAEAEPHFRYAVTHLPVEQRRLLERAAASPLPRSERSAGTDQLARRGLLVEVDDGLAPFSEAFAAWLSEGGRPEPTEEPTVASGPGLLRDAVPRAGDVLLDRHELRSILGRGGFGIVFLAQDRLLGRQVAVKLLNGRSRTSTGAERLRDRFLQEARAAARISHPNVVAVHDLGEIDGEFFVVMEYFEGSSLRQLLDARGRLPEGDAVDLAAQAARGLHAAHELGIVHRDVKPENILVDETGRLKIVDFGIAYVVSELRLTTDGGTPMTPRYSSPEQVLGEQVEARSDVFGLGCVLFEMLTGTFAFDGSSTSAVLYQILHASPPPNARALDDVTPELAAVTLRCLAREPWERPASCEELADELDVLGGRPGG